MEGGYLITTACILLGTSIGILIAFLGFLIFLNINEKIANRKD